MSMFCVECGSRIADTAVFCPNCGAKIRVPSAVLSVGTDSRRTSAPEKKKSPVGLIIGIIAAAAVLIALIIALVAVLPGSGNKSSGETSAAEESVQKTESEKSPASEASSDAEADENASVEESPAEDSPVGHYTMTELTLDGTTYSTAMISILGGESSLDVNEDGTFRMYVSMLGKEVSADGTWSDGTVTIEGGEFPFVYDPSSATITITIGGSNSATFTNESVSPAV